MIDLTTKWNDTILESGTQPASFCTIQRHNRETMLNNLNVDEYEFLTIDNQWCIIPKSTNCVWQKGNKTAMLEWIDKIRKYIEVDYATGKWFL